MINIVDLSAIDKLIDYHGPNCSVQFQGKTINLYDLRDYCEFYNMRCDLETYNVKPDGIYQNDTIVISVLDTNKNSRDDLTDI